VDLRGLSIYHQGTGLALRKMSEGPLGFKAEVKELVQLAQE
jgi:hypothetical protein